MAMGDGAKDGWAKDGGESCRAARGKAKMTLVPLPGSLSSTKRSALWL